MHTYHNKGFTLLYASLVISILLALALAIANISFQQFLLSSSGKESQIAFYNADTGIECGLYYDHGKGGLDFPTDQASQDSAITGGKIITCAGISSQTPQKVSTTSSTAFITTYKINPSGSCTLTNATTSMEIEVTKVQGQIPNTFTTIIRSRGYDTCDSNNPRRVERGLLVQY